MGEADMWRLAQAVVIESECLIGELLCDVLANLGFKVYGSTANMGDAKKIVDSGKCDFAVVNMDIGGCISAGMLDHLAMRDVPFVLTTDASGDEVPKHYQSDRWVAKPYGVAEIRRALDSLRPHVEQNDLGAHWPSHLMHAAF
jgi:hypothetical protein